MLTHRNLVANLCQYEPVRHIDEGDRVIAVLPFFHIYGQTLVLNDALRRGARIVTLPRFDLAQFLAAIEQHRITACYVAPPVVLALAKHPLVDDHDLSSLRFITSGAAPLDAELQARGRAARRLPRPAGLRPDRGESGHAPRPPGRRERARHDRHAAAEHGGAPRRCRDGARTPPPAEPGEIWVRGPQVMLGYLGDEDATASTLTSDGWLRTGDIATVDEGGRFRVVDRLKELIKYKGYQVPPAQLEGILLTHPQIADACVVPVRDEEAGEVPKAFVVPREGQALDPREVMAFVAGRVAPHMQVRACELIDAIPEVALGQAAAAGARRARAGGDAMTEGGRLAGRVALVTGGGPRARARGRRALRARGRARRDRRDRRRPGARGGGGARRGRPRHPVRRRAARTTSSGRSMPAWSASGASTSSSTTPPSSGRRSGTSSRSTSRPGTSCSTRTSRGTSSAPRARRGTWSSRAPA